MDKRPKTPMTRSHSHICIRILQMDKELMVKQVIFVMFKVRSDGDMLMDASQHTTWRELYTYTCDKDFWITRVRSLGKIPMHMHVHKTSESDNRHRITYRKKLHNVFHNQ